jgi:hypothetical protein
MQEQDLFPNLPATKEETAPVVSREDALLSTVLASGNIEVLERYIALRKSEEERQARIAFEEAFSRMRRELPSIAKKKAVSIRGNHAYSYAPVEEIQRLCDPIIYKHGFSYSWREDAIDAGKRVFLDIFGYGHTKTNSFDVPVLGQITSRDGNQVTNAVQAAGAMSTYGRRYTFISGFGIIVEGEDADGQISDDGEILSFDLKAMLEERDGSGKFILSPEAHEAITKELAKAEPSITRLKHFYKLGKEKIRKVKP